MPIGIQWNIHKKQDGGQKRVLMSIDTQSFQSVVNRKMAVNTIKTKKSNDAVFNHNLV